MNLSVDADDLTVGRQQDRGIVVMTAFLENGSQQERDADAPDEGPDAVELLALIPTLYRRWTLK